MVEDEVNKCYNKPLKPIRANLTPEQRLAIKTLKDKANQIIIKTADKGSTLTVVKTTKYIQDGLEHLSDRIAYEILEEDPTPVIAGGIKNYITQLHNKGYINKIEKDYLLPDEMIQTQYIYFPYKIHKNPISIRPVVAGMASPTAKISKYLDHFFKKQVLKAKSYLKNSHSLVEIIKNLRLNTETQTLLISVDVKSLYTSIPQEDGMKALLQHNELIGLPPFVTRKLLNYVLNNIFSFNGTIYKQNIVKKVYDFSDGAASQYKNKKNFVNLAFHNRDFKNRHFFATDHGKGPPDGLGGTVKREAARASLKRPLEG